MKTNTGFVLVTLLGVLLVVGLYGFVSEDKPQPIERNYEGEYYLGLIPNSPELPATRADIVLAQDQTKELIQSPFGYVYLRDR